MGMAQPWKEGSRSRRSMSSAIVATDSQKDPLQPEKSIYCPSWCWTERDSTRTTEWWERCRLLILPRAATPLLLCDVVAHLHQASYEFRVQERDNWCTHHYFPLDFPACRAQSNLLMQRYGCRRHKWRSKCPASGKKLLRASAPRPPPWTLAWHHKT